MNIRDNPALREKLAAEYVLGTLRSAARRRFERWLEHDAALRAATADWHRRLAPLAELGRPVTPPARIWSGIERRLQPAPGATTAAGAQSAAGARDARDATAAAGAQGPADAPWWRSWRAAAARPWAGLALAASAVALVLAATLAGRREAAPPRQVAALTDAQAHTALVVTADTERRRLEVRVAADLRVPDDRTLQLWAIARDGTPRSLGILPGNRGADLALDARATGPDVMLLAISLEPKGGSPNPNAPTGPVLYKGSWTRL